MHFVIGIDEFPLNIGRKYLDATKHDNGRYVFTDPYKYKYSVSETMVCNLGKDLTHSTNYYSTYLAWKSIEGFGGTIDETESNYSNQDITVKTVIVEKDNIGMVKATIKDTRDEPKLEFPLIAKSLDKGSVSGVGGYTVLFRSDSNGTVISGNKERKIGDVLSWMCPQFSESMTGCWEILPAGVQVILENK